MVFKKLATKLEQDRQRQSVAGMAYNPIDIDFKARKNLFINKMSESALKLYEREQDIKKFTKMALEEQNKNSDDHLIDMLFKQGVIDPLDDEKLFGLSSNAKLLKDLGI